MSTIEELEEKAKQLVRENQHEKAAAVVQELLEKDPENDAMWNRLSMIFMKLKKDQEAEQAIDKALEINPREVEHKIQKAYIRYMQDDKESTIKISKEIIDMDPGNIDALLYLGWIAKDEERYTDAIGFFETILEQDPEDASGLIELIDCLLETNNLDQAGTRIQQLVKLPLSEGLEKTKKEQMVRYFTEKAMESWTGSFKDEEGATLFYPETAEQIEQSEHYLEMAQDTGTDSEYYLNRIAELEEVLSINRQKLGLSKGESSDGNRDNLSENDRLASEKLEEVFDLWTNIREEDGMEYRWPAGEDEIKQSEKLLAEIKKLKIKDKQVKERFKELKEVVQDTKKRLPNYSSKFVKSFAISAIAIIGLLALFQMQKFKKPEFNYNISDWVINEPTQLVYDAFAGETYKPVRNPLMLAPGTKVTPITRVGRYWMQVETHDGNLGYVYYRSLKGANRGIIEENTPLYTNYATKKFTDSLKKDMPITVLGYQKEGKEQYANLVRVRTANGQTGIVPYYHIFLPFKDSVPSISQTYIYPTTIQNLEKMVLNTPLKTAEAKYGPVSSIISANGKKTAYFRQIQVIKDQQRYRGVFFDLDAKNNILAYELNKPSKRKLLDKLPLVQRITTLEPFGLIQFSFYKTDDNNLFEWEWWQNFKAKHWTTKVLGWIIQVLVGLVLILLFFSIPRLLINPVMLLFSHTRLLGNGMVLFINFIIYGGASYLFFIWMALLMNQIFTPLLFALPAFLFWWYVYRNQIKYNRCPNCHTMNIAMDKGSSYHGRSKSVSWGTYDVYKGQTETSTQIIDHYERRDKKTTSYTDHYTDHRECIRCGYAWGVEREESAGSSTTHY